MRLIKIVFPRQIPISRLAWKCGTNVFIWKEEKIINKKERMEETEVNRIPSLYFSFDILPTFRQNEEAKKNCLLWLNKRFEMFVNVCVLKLSMRIMITRVSSVGI